MKEFTMKHPFLTCLMADSLIGGVVGIVRAIAGAFGRGNSETTSTTTVTFKEEETQDEPSGDNQ